MNDSISVCLLTSVMYLRSITSGLNYTASVSIFFVILPYLKSNVGEPDIVDFLFKMAFLSSGSAADSDDGVSGVLVLLLLKPYASAPLLSPCLLLPVAANPATSAAIC